MAENHKASVDLHTESGFKCGQRNGSAKKVSMFSLISDSFLPVFPGH